MRNSDAQTNYCSNCRWFLFLIVAGKADEWLLSFTDGLQIDDLANRTIIKGTLNDISAVYGLIIGLRDMSAVIEEIKIKRLSGCQK